MNGLNIYGISCYLSYYIQDKYANIAVTNNSEMIFVDDEAIEKLLKIKWKLTRTWIDIFGRENFRLDSFDSVSGISSLILFNSGLTVKFLDTELTINNEKLIVVDGKLFNEPEKVENVSSKTNSNFSKGNKGVFGELKSEISQKKQKDSGAADVKKDRKNIPRPINTPMKKLKLKTIDRKYAKIQVGHVLDLSGPESKIKISTRTVI
jgi:hypothetical protein